jgi:hypothetical protein
LLWDRRDTWPAGITASAAVIVSAVCAWVLLDRSGGWNAWLRPTIAGAAALATVVFLFGLRHRALAVAAVGLAAVAGLAGPTAYALQTVTNQHVGAIPSAGPTVKGGQFGPGGAGGPGGRGGPGANGQQFGPPPGAGQAGGANGAPPAFGNQLGGFGGPGGGAGMGGLLGASTPSATLVTALTTDAGRYTWIVATVGSNQAAGYQLATDHAVLAIGGFNGSDPSPTLAQFQAWVKEGKIHYFIGGGGFGNQNGGSQSSTEIANWVTSHYTATTVGGTTVYDLTAASH